MSNREAMMIMNALIICAPPSDAGEIAAENWRITCRTLSLTIQRIAPETFDRDAFVRDCLAMTMRDPNEAKP